MSDQQPGESPVDTRAVSSARADCYYMVSEMEFSETMDVRVAWIVP
jgi:hypothetical protein